MRRHKEPELVDPEDILVAAVKAYEDYLWGKLDTLHIAMRLLKSGEQLEDCRPKVL